jgi:hypothetical protein
MLAESCVLFAANLQGEQLSPKDAVLTHME